MFHRTDKETGWFPHLETNQFAYFVKGSDAAAG
jgi:hypothetical protein